MSHVISHEWLSVKPPNACEPDYLVEMPIKTAAIAMAENLKALGKSRDGLRTQLQVAKRAGVGEGTVSRARRGDGNTTLSNLEAIARAYGLEAWQLIRPEFAVKPESGEPSEADESALLQVYRALSPAAQTNLMTIAMSLFQAQKTQAGITARDSLASRPGVGALMERAPDVTREAEDVQQVPQKGGMRNAVREADRDGSDRKGSGIGAGSRPAGRKKKPQNQD